MELFIKNRGGEMGAKQVLVVDDSLTIRLYHQQILEAAGMQVTHSENGYEALEKVLSQSFDLFLVDVNMPMMDGYVFLLKLRELSDAPAIMISTEAAAGDAQRAYAAGASLYIVKPVNPHQLLTQIQLLTGTEQ